MHLDLWRELIPQVEQYMASLAAVDDLEVLDMDLITDDPHVAGHDGDPVVQNSETATTILVEQAVPDLAVDGVVALEVADVLVEQGLADPAACVGEHIRDEVGGGQQSGAGLLDARRLRHGELLDHREARIHGSGRTLFQLDKLAASDTRELDFGEPLER